MSAYKHFPYLFVLALVPNHGFSALYRVVEVDTSAFQSASEYYSASIAPSTSQTSCFDSSCDEDDHQVVGYSMNGLEGLPIDEEVPFDIDNHFYYLTYSDLEDYCEDQLGYATCEAWAENRWYGSSDTGIGGLQNERQAYYNADYSPLYASFIENDSDVTQQQVVPDDYSDDVTSVDDTMEIKARKVDAQGNIIANASSGYFNYSGYYVLPYRSRGLIVTDDQTISLEPQADTELTYADEESEQTIISQMGGTIAFDSFTYSDGTESQTYVVGSAAVATFDYDDDSKEYYSDVDICADGTLTQPLLDSGCQNFRFASKAYIWSLSDDGETRFSVADWDTSDYANYDEASAQASVRSATIVDREDSDYDGLPVLVGFNTELESDDDAMMMQAAVFRPSNTESFAVGEDAWESTFISNTELEQDGDYIYSNSLAKAVNSNLIVIGEAKRKGSVPVSGTAANRMFVADANDATPSATYFNNLGHSIFFTSVGGEVNGINSFNEIVGEVDAESHSEIDSSQRRRRGFILPYDGEGSDEDRMTRFESTAWWLDDLTNGGDYSDDNNAYRIVTASDINDQGVISATAIKCEGGYDSTEHFATCGEGDQEETVVAVKLMPIQDATSYDIEEREESTDTVDREGGSSSWWWMSLLVALLLMRFGRVSRRC
ncbi:DUF3466 family protein [Vibrio hippocampi]|uniref:DUF3466 family protein n=1 Tax=Vibrio hippocampi TaxID=654686 RepID=A0ABM8ZMK3_9VIBR|nr:DUF3466 family protein [Vibrio hippocampi]CAH0529732.1 hypothetical protein VHP8226_03488 [Vibrio hippocampi]